MDTMKPARYIIWILLSRISDKSREREFETDFPEAPGASRCYGFASTKLPSPATNNSLDFYILGAVRTGYAVCVMYVR